MNILPALTDIGPGDGGTHVLPGSHKRHFIHPACAAPYGERAALGGEVVEGAIEVHLCAGDALMFVDGLCHGASKRSNPGGGGARARGLASHPARRRPAQTNTANALRYRSGVIPTRSRKSRVK